MVYDKNIKCILKKRKVELQKMEENSTRGKIVKLSNKTEETIEEFGKGCKRYGFSECLFGKSFTEEGKSYRFVGFNFRFKKSPCIVEDLEGVRYQCASGYIKAKLLENIMIPTSLMSIEYVEKCLNCENLNIDSAVNAISSCKCELFEGYISHLEFGECRDEMKRMYLDKCYKPFCKYKKGIPTLSFPSTKSENEEEK